VDRPSTTLARGNGKDVNGAKAFVSYPNVNREKIASVRRNALSTAAADVRPFLMTSAWQ
jgi:hypothetical protein